MSFFHLKPDGDRGYIQVTTVGERRAEAIPEAEEWGIRES